MIPFMRSSASRRTKKEEIVCCGFGDAKENLSLFIMYNATLERPALGNSDFLTIMADFQY